jgi:porin
LLLDANEPIHGICAVCPASVQTARWVSYVSNFVIDAALQSGQLAYTGNFSITAALYAAIAPGIRVGIGVGYTNNPTPVIFTPQTGSNLNLLANVITYW